MFLCTHCHRCDIWFGMKGRRGMFTLSTDDLLFHLGIKPIFLFLDYISFLLNPEVSVFPLVWFVVGLFSFQGLLSTDSSSPVGRYFPAGCKSICVLDILSKHTQRCIENISQRQTVWIVFSQSEQHDLPSLITVILVSVLNQYQKWISGNKFKSSKTVLFYYTSIWLGIITNTVVLQINPTLIQPELEKLVL